MDEQMICGAGEPKGPSRLQEAATERGRKALFGSVGLFSRFGISTRRGVGSVSALLRKPTAAASYGVILLAVWTLLAATAAPLTAQDIGEIERHLRVLASDQAAGRGNGTPEGLLIAEYISREMEAFGLQPAGQDGTYFQDFEFQFARHFGSENRVEFRLGENSVALELGWDYVPLSFGGQREIHSSLVFVGFGIHAPDLNYDDYRGLDVRGKVVVMFDHEPQENSPDGIFSGRQLSVYGSELYKILHAKSRGAAAVILLPDTFQHGPSQERSLERSREIEDLGIPAIRLSSRWSQELLAMGGLLVHRFGSWIDSHLIPLSFEIPAVQASLSVDVVTESRIIRNVIGLLPGESDEFIVLGAHYDHLGTGGPASLSPDLRGEIHNGADDNASGVSALLELARILAKEKLERGILFVSFGGEELGLLGSQHFVDNPTVPMERGLAMLNMDMIGRSDGRLLIGGVGTAPAFEAILNGLQPFSDLQFEYAYTPHASSDHLSFARRGVPVLFFFTGLHMDYHRPSDEISEIEFERLTEVARVVGDALRVLSSRSVDLEYVDLLGSDWAAPNQRSPLFGSIPDTSWMEDGVRMDGVLPESPAAQAGLQPGDILIRFGRHPISSIYDLKVALNSYRPDQVVDVTVLRSGSVIRRQVRLAAPY